MQNTRNTRTGRLAGIFIILLLLPGFLFAIGQVEVVEGKSTIVHDETASSGDYFETLSDQQGVIKRTDNEILLAVSSNADILLQLQSLQAELRQLRGLVEEQRHAIETLDRKRIDDYLDIDHRFSIFQQAQVESPPVASEEGLNFSFVPMVTAQLANKGLNPSEQPLSIDEEAKQSYRESYQLVKDREFEQAQISLEIFIKRYPNSSYMPNAYFWLGELQYLAMELPLSRDSFLALIEQYPQHKKVADAKFKLGKVYHQLGHSEKSRTLLESVIRDHSSSSAANPAREYLSSNLR